MPFEARTSVVVRKSADGSVVTVIVPSAGADLEAIERALIVFALESAANNRMRAAKLLRLTRSALLQRMQKDNLSAVRPDGG